MSDRRLVERCRRVRWGAVTSRLTMTAALCFFGAGPVESIPETIGGPYAALLDHARNLGPSRHDRIQLTVALRDASSADSLLRWAARESLAARWQAGADWAIVEGPPGRLGAAFDVPVRDYRTRTGQVFYASPRQPAVPAALRGTVDGVGRVLGFTPHREARPLVPALDVPPHGLTPDALLNAYDVAPLAAAGYTGKGQTIVFYEFDGYDQADLDEFATRSGLPPLIPTLVGGPLGPPHGEAVMDLEVARAIAPDARLVVVDARPTLAGGRTYERIAETFDTVDRRFPGAVWSLSIGWGCDALVTATDLKPVQSALERAAAHGTSAYDATGDNGGLECKGGHDWSAAPSPADVGLDAVAALPAMTSVGGTTLSTDEHGQWFSEQAWVDSPLSQGSSGGVSRWYPRPPWQRRVTVARDAGMHRLTPDVAATGDPFTGVRVRFDGQDLVGGGTSQAAPIWAALTAVMNQFLVANGGRALGDPKPLLYRVAAGANRPGFRDVALGGNAVDLAEPGFDLVTGLGSPSVDALAHDLLDVQRGTAPK